LKERRELFKIEWDALIDEEGNLEKARTKLREIERDLNKSENHENGDIFIKKLEIEKIALQKADLKNKLENIHVIIDNFNQAKNSDIQKKSIENNEYLENMSELSDIDLAKSKKNSDFDKTKEYFSDSGEEDRNRPKQLKYYDLKKVINFSDSNSDNDGHDSYLKINEAFDKFDLEYENNDSILYNIGKQKESVQSTNLLLEKYREQIDFRKLNINIQINEARENSDETESVNFKNRKLNFQKETIHLEHMNLNLKKIKKLNNQRNGLLILLEQIFGSLCQGKSNNSNQADIGRENANSDGAHDPKKIVEKIEKLNKKLNLSLNNLVFLNFLKENSEESQNGSYNLISTRNEFTKNVFSTIENDPSKFFKEISFEYKLKEKNWEKSPIYQRLILDKSSRILDQKWKYYFGVKKTPKNKIYHINESRVSNQTNQVDSSLSPIILRNLENRLLDSTKTRLNQHKQWLKNFKNDFDSSKKYQY
jgi:hypothetical protein